MMSEGFPITRGTLTVRDHTGTHVDVTVLDVHLANAGLFYQDEADTQPRPLRFIPFSEVVQLVRDEASTVTDPGPVVNVRMIVEGQDDLHAHVRVQVGPSPGELSYRGNLKLRAEELAAIGAAGIAWIQVDDRRGT